MDDIPVFRQAAGLCHGHGHYRQLRGWDGLPYCRQTVDAQGKKTRLFPSSRRGFHAGEGH